MKERLVTLALACGAFALFYALFLPTPIPKDLQATQPLSAEQGPNGYFALRSWLEGEGLRVISLRERYSKLGTLHEEGRGNLLMTTMPHKLGARANELEELRNWLNAGNTLLVMAGLADTPDWAMDGEHGNPLIPALSELSGIGFYVAYNDEDETEEDQEQAKEEGAADQANEQKKTTKANARRRIVDATRQLLQPAQREAAPTDAHPLLDGVKTIKALSEFPADDWRARAEENVTAVIELAHLNSDSKAPALWLANYGKGQIIVSGFASPFTNKLLGQGDNARLLANIVAWSVAPTGAIFLDDAHQGANEFYDPQAFFGDARLHRALLWLVVLWLIFILGPSRLRAKSARWNPVDIVSFVRATGGFMARTLRPAEAGRRALYLFFNGIRRRLGLPQDGAPTWEWLAAQGRVTTADLAQLRAYHERTAQGRRIDFAKLHNLLVRIEEGFV